MKPHRITGLRCGLFAALSAIGLGASLASAQSVTSPDGNVQCTISVAGGRLSYAVSFKGSPVIDTSPLGATVNGVDLGGGVQVGTTTTYAADETFPWRGVHAVAINRYNGRRYPVTHTASTTSYTLDVRAFNDGVAFMYSIPGSGTRTINGEATSFVLPTGSTVWYQNTFDKYEGGYHSGDISTIATGTISGPPLTIRLPGGQNYAAITEGGLIGYSGMHLVCDATRRFKATLADASFSVSGAIQVPWRVIMIGSLNALVNCDIPACVSPAPDAALFPNGMATSWIKPGRSTWSWLNATRSITPANMKTYSQRASQLGIENNIVDDGWKAWTDRWNQLKDLTTFANGLNPPVKTWVWVNYNDIKDQTARRQFFADCKTAGVVGVKVDFMDAETKAIIDFDRAALRDAAAQQLMINFHGANKPTGEARTFPNELTREAVKGKEGRPGAAHQVLIPFTRSLAGATDYTPMDLNATTQNSSLVSNEIASAICITSPLLVFSEDPQTILSSPFVSLIRNIPATWDETIVLPQSDVGKVASLARRKGTRWMVGVMNGTTAVSSATINLSFLAAGKNYQAKMIRDNATAFETRSVTSASTIQISLAAAGGFVAEFTETGSNDTTGTVYQAESAVLGGGAALESTNGGFNGSGYVNSPTTGGSIEFRNVDGGTGGAKTLHIRNALGATAARTGSLIINGVRQSITFAPTGSWTTWAIMDVPVTLSSGTANTIRFETTGTDLANIDQIQI